MVRTSDPNEGPSVSLRTAVAASVAQTVSLFAPRTHGTPALRRALTPGHRVLVTIPAHNEERMLRESVERLTEILTASGIEFTLSVAEDGSTDGTRGVIDQIVRDHPEIIVQTHTEKRGRGWALRTLWSTIDADYYAFSDADFAADPRFLARAIRAAQHGNPIVVGSRYVAGARVLRPPLRRLTSQAYNRLMRLLFSGSVRDHQCGLKVFSREALDKLLPLSHEDSWFWDTEMLVRARDCGLDVLEIPVDWVERKVGRTQFHRLASDVFVHGTGALRLAGNRTARPPVLVGRPTPTGYRPDRERTLSR
jgi:glycosyltransferase involved in cell wall biosynthesis